MASPKIFTYSGFIQPITFRAGFTLIEVTIVMSLVVLVASFGLIANMETYRGYSFRTERDALIATLQKARSESVSNMCFGSSCTDGRPHGVHLAPHGYVLFQGESYATRDSALDETIAARYFGVAMTSPSLTDIVFSRLAGTTTPNPFGTPTISLVDSAGSGSSVITINPEGQITWTN